ncbi:MAG: hypothetical protein ACRDRS_13425 [Pseudonocardiaceae bacterium]
MPTTPLGIAGYLAFVAARTGRPDGWLYLQHEGWGYSYDLGRQTVHDSGAILAHSDDAMLVITVAVVLGYLVLALLAVRGRLSWPVVAYSIGATVVATTAAYTLAGSWFNAYALIVWKYTI